MKSDRGPRNSSRLKARILRLSLVLAWSPMQVTRFFSGTGLERVTRQATIRYLYHKATEAYRHFRKGKERVEDDKSSGRLQTFRPAGNMETVSAELRRNRIQTIGKSVWIS
ncbi:hypothetical protein TNCV_1479611 [Trichonephila clavipes]|nr:hypothetical protein TNCV_1479611 [Trichonephila clavipes]